jgi:phosphatidylinositol alpha-1,6-mannosyltransferase
MTRAGVLLTTRNLPPLQGGMERLNAHLAQALGAEFTLYLCGPNGVDGKALGARRSIAAPNLGLAGFLLTNFVATLWMAIRYRPQLVLAGSGLTAEGGGGGACGGVGAGGDVGAGSELTAAGAASRD